MKKQEILNWSYGKTRNLEFIHSKSNGRARMKKAQTNDEKSSGIGYKKNVTSQEYDKFQKVLEEV